MKNKFLLVIASLLLFIFLVFGTYAWYLYFLKSNIILDNVNKNESEVNIGSIVLKDEGYGVYIDDAKSIEDTEMKNVIPYRFQVINEGINADNYYLYIEDLPPNSINDGCTEATLLTRDKLKYQLKLNGRIISSGVLSDIKDNILDNRSIEGKTNNLYELKIYIHDKAKDWTGKHYHYKVVLGK